MMLVGLGEIVVVVLLRPLRFLLGGQRTPPVAQSFASSTGCCTIST